MRQIEISKEYGTAGAAHLIKAGRILQLIALQLPSDTKITMTPGGTTMVKFLMQKSMNQPVLWSCNTRGPASPEELACICVEFFNTKTQNGWEFHNPAREAREQANTNHAMWANGIGPYQQRGPSPLVAFMKQRAVHTETRKSGKAFSQFVAAQMFGPHGTELDDAIREWQRNTTLNANILLEELSKQGIHSTLNTDTGSLTYHGIQTKKHPDVMSRIRQFHDDCITKKTGHALTVTHLIGTLSDWNSSRPQTDRLSIGDVSKYLKEHHNHYSSGSETFWPDITAEMKFETA